jgi:hypothetical protein
VEGLQNPVEAVSPKPDPSSLKPVEGIRKPVDPSYPKPDPSSLKPVEAASHGGGNQGTSVGKLGEPNPGISRVDTPQVDPAGSTTGKQPVQGPRKWDTVKTDTGLRKGIEPGITRGETPPLNPAGSTTGKKPVQGPKKWDTVKTDTGLRKGIEPGITRGDTPLLESAGSTKGKQPVQGAKKWPTVEADGGLRHEISPGAVTDEASGYNKMAVKQELFGAKEGTPVPGRNKLPDFNFGGDMAFDDAASVASRYDIHHPPPGIEELGGKLTDTVDNSVNSIIKKAGKRQKKIWRKLGPEIAHVESGWTKVLSAVNKGWNAIWDTILWPIKELFKMVKDLLAMIGKWLGLVAKGRSCFAKVARGFQKVFTAVKGKYEIPAMSRFFSSALLTVCQQRPRHGKQ